MHSKKIGVTADFVDFAILCGSGIPVDGKSKKEKLRKAWQGDISCRALRSFSHHNTKMTTL